MGLKRTGKRAILLAIHVCADDECQANEGENGEQVHVCVYVYDSLKIPGWRGYGCDDRHHGDENVHVLLLRENGCGCDCLSTAVPRQAERAELQSRR